MCKHIYHFNFGVRNGIYTYELCKYQLIYVGKNSYTRLSYVA